jgi:hypothetical protein
MVNRLMAMVSRARADQGARRAVAGMVLAAAPLLYTVPAGAAQYSQVWSATFGNETGLQYLQAGMALSCIFIPLAPVVCIPLAFV